MHICIYLYMFTHMYGNFSCSTTMALLKSIWPPDYIKGPSIMRGTTAFVVALLCTALRVQG